MFSLITLPTVFIMLFAHYYPDHQLVRLSVTSRVDLYSLYMHLHSHGYLCTCTQMCIITGINEVCCWLF